MKKLIVGFAFGIPDTTANLLLAAMIVDELVRSPSSRVYTQSEEYIPINPHFSERITRIEETPGNPAPTLRIARGAVAYAIENGISQIFVVCAKPHLWRCLRDLHKVALGEREYIEIVAVDEIQESKWSEWFCPDCTQLRARSIPVWLFYDLILRCMPWSLYKRIGS